MFYELNALVRKGVKDCMGFGTVVHLSAVPVLGTRRDVPDVQMRTKMSINEQVISNKMRIYQTTPKAALFFRQYNKAQGADTQRSHAIRIGGFRDAADKKTKMPPPLSTLGTVAGPRMQRRTETLKNTWDEFSHR
jgi:hypothetical protein